MKLTDAALSSTPETSVDNIPSAIHQALDRVEKLMVQRLWADAYDVLCVVSHELDALGIASPYVAWLCGVASDSSGRLAEAVVHIARARSSLDPASWQARRSEQIIVGRVLGLIDAAGVDDVLVRMVVEVARHHYAPSHVFRQELDDKLADKRTADVTAELSALARPAQA